jgi:hypothetical protein
VQLAPEAELVGQLEQSSAVLRRGAAAGAAAAYMALTGTSPDLSQVFGGAD